MGFAGIRRAVTRHCGYPKCSRWIAQPIVSRREADNSMQALLMNRKYSSTSRRPKPNVAVDNTAELLDAAMRDSEAPVMEIARALARISTALAQSRSSGSAEADYVGGMARIENDISICIESLQFHDRLIQQ